MPMHGFVFTFLLIDFRETEGRGRWGGEHQFVIASTHTHIG